ncbi:MAG: hypothetical protein ACF788_10630 [Novipirellula sp. JB048]
MATENDYHLQPRNDELSDVICNRCESEIGEVYVAQQTMAGRDTGRTEAEVTTDARQIVQEHLEQCPQRDRAPEASETQAATPPKTAPLDKRR